MSTFVILIYDNEQAKEETREIANNLKIALYDEGYGFAPYVEKPYLFLEDPVVSSIFGFASHYHKEGIETFDELFSLIQAEIEIEQENVNKFKKRKDYKQILEKYLHQLRLLEDKQKDLSKKLEVYSETGDYSSQEYFDKVTEYNKTSVEISKLIERQEKYFFLTLDNNFEQKKQRFSLNMQLYEQFSTKFLRLQDFMKQVVESNGKVEVLWHNSDHSQNEYIPMNEERSIGISNITLETFAFLPDNTLLRIVK